MILHHFQTTAIEHLAISVSSYNLDYISRETIHLFDLLPQFKSVADFSFEIDHLDSALVRAFISPVPRIKDFQSSLHYRLGDYPAMRSKRFVAKQNQRCSLQRGLSFGCFDPDEVQADFVVFSSVSS